MAYEPRVETVSDGGTGLTTLTIHSIQVGNGTSSPTQLAVGATGTVLQGVTASDPAFTATPSVTSITLGGGSALSTFTDWTTWTPTLIGQTVAGASTYTSQTGFYSRVGNIVVATFLVQVSAATGTGNINIGGLPFTIHNDANYQPTGSCFFNSAGATWPAGTTNVSLYGLTNTTTIAFATNGSGVNTAFIQMANTDIQASGTLIYRV